MIATLLQVRVGSIQDHAVPKNVMRKVDSWKSGIRKLPLEGSVIVSPQGLDGDQQADLVNHGGKDKAILCYPREHYARWSIEFGVKAPAQGTLGENFELSGVTEDDVCVGDIFQVGEVLLQLSQPRQPCWKPAQFHGLSQLTARILKSGRTGWYLRVLTGGMLTAPDQLELVERPVPDWTVTRATQVMHFSKDPLLRRELATVEELSDAWKIDLSEAYRTQNRHRNP